MWRLLEADKLQQFEEQEDQHSFYVRQEDQSSNDGNNS
jgi:hypothetical protein